MGHVGTAIGANPWFLLIIHIVLNMVKTSLLPHNFRNCHLGQGDFIFWVAITIAPSYFELASVGS